MRLHIGAVLAVAVVAGSLCACEALSGLNNYSTGPNGALGAFEDAGGGTGDDAPGGSDSPVTTPASDATDDNVALDMWVPTEAGGGESDAGADKVEIVDAGKPDNYVCNSSTCNGCCDSAGACRGGQSVASCGTSGGACRDCTDAGGGCTSAGQCGAASTTTAQCTATNITTCKACAAAIYTACCKSDHTCGCQWTGFAPCQ